MASDRPTVSPQQLPRFTTAPPTRLERVAIGSLDDPGKGIEAQYNPRELSIDRQVPWTPHKVNKANEPDLEFTGGDARTMSLELLFDGFESGKSVEQAVLDLAELATVRDPKAKDENHLRPHLVAVAWGGDGGKGKKIEPFRGVIESLSTKYTMFLADGTPVRATCTIKVKEARKLGLAKQR